MENIISEINQKKIAHFVVKSIYDEEISDKETRLENTYDIQAGAGLSERRICELCDDYEENISLLNRNFCELTVIYWMWKHIHTEYVGIRHYRRYFDITQEQLNHMMDENVDAFLPYAYVLKINLEDSYKKFHFSDAWNTMKSVLASLYPEYVPTAQKVFSENLMLMYNMGIYKKEYFDAYCEWLFPIIFKTYEIIGDKLDVYQNRYPGFLAERLAVVFYEHNKDKYKVDMCSYKDVKVIQSIDHVAETVKTLPYTEEAYLEYIQELFQKNQFNKMRSIPAVFDRTQGQLPKVDAVGTLLEIHFFEMKHKSTTLFDDCKDVYHLVDIYMKLQEYVTAVYFQKYTFISFVKENKISRYGVFQVIAESGCSYTRANEVALAYVDSGMLAEALFILSTARQYDMQDEETNYNIIKLLLSVGETGLAESIYYEFGNSSERINQLMSK